VAFVVMPWAEIRWPSIGVSILQAALASEGIDSDVLYPNLDLADAIGAATYNLIGAKSPKTALVGDWLFADHGHERDYVTRVLLGEHAKFFDLPMLYRLGEVSTLTGPFLDALADDPVWTRYDIVGFTSTFQQNVAALGLAHRLKERHPDLTVLLGGGNCEGPMGAAILRNHPAIDYVFQGEAESLIAAFVRDLRQAGGDSTWFASNPFWAARSSAIHDGRRIIRCDQVASMDDVPIPSYGDFHARLRHERPGHDRRPTFETAIPFETSRGCWWGERSHCTFCGLNGQTMKFRSKSPDRAFEELRGLIDDYGPGGGRRTYVLVVDNILDYHYLSDFLPKVAASELKANLHYEVKANLRLDQLALLRDAGVVHLQPGIESMSNRLLAAMRKGTTRLRNIQTMKWCVELGIGVSWNYLYGFPGETDEDYLDLPELFGLISHLPPPEHVGLARADRFSPFYETPDVLGITALEREPAYDYVYADVPARDRDDLAYFFRLSCATPLSSEQVRHALSDAADDWRRAHGEARLEAQWTGDGFRIRDTRPARRHDADTFELDDEASAVLLALDQMRTRDGIERSLWKPLADHAIAAALERLLELGLVLRDGDGYLGLPILARRDLPAATRAERRRTRLAVVTSR
jgi:ribosomal peptide maturation radical SAM protein 1